MARAGAGGASVFSRPRRTAPALSQGLRGGIKGSYPLDGEYGRYEVLNWATKFFVDALIRHDGLTMGLATAGDDPLVAGLMVILHIVAPGAAGGLEGVLEILAAGLQSRGHEVHVAAVVAPGGEYHTLDVLARSGRLGSTPSLVTPRAYHAERSRISQLCRLIVPDIVHTHGYRPDVLDAPVARRLGLPTVTTVHGFTRGGSGTACTTASARSRSGVSR